MRINKRSGESQPDDLAGGSIATIEHELVEEEARPATGHAPLLQRIVQFELTPKRVKRKDLLHFSRQLAVFIKAGIPIIDALETIASEVKHKYFRQVLDEAAANLRAGTTFAGSIEAHADAFPPYYLGIVRSAELTGQLDDALDQLAEYIDRDVEARQKIVSALTYPAVVAAMAIVVVIALISFVLPRFKNFFTDLDAKLPL